MGKRVGLDLSLSLFVFSPQPDGIKGPRIPWLWTESLYIGPEIVWGCGGVEFVYDIVKCQGLPYFIT